VALYPDDGETVESLLRQSDAAMYAAKLSGRGTYCFYDENTCFSKSKAE
jgi:GGDEF domain-containing protein